MTSSSFDAGDSISLSDAIESVSDVMAPDSHLNMTHDIVTCYISSVSHYSEHVMRTRGGMTIVIGLS